MRPSTIVAIITVVLVLAVFLGLTGQLFEYLDASEIMVIQAPFSGALRVVTTPGVYWQGAGTVSHYPKRSQVWFSSRKDQGDKVDESLAVRFNDNGRAWMSLGISWEMPADPNHVLLLHTKFRSKEAIEKQLVEPVIQKAVFAVGPLMSSQESAASRRNDLFQYLEDQIQNGVYRTETQAERQKDPMTGTEKTVNVTRVVMDKEGKPVRSDDAPLREFGVRAFNPVINEIKYDEVVEKQIQEQQKAIMQVQTAIANAKEAEQRAITAMKSGEADAAKAKWTQEALKATAVTKAQQELEVAKLDTQTAEQVKQKQILEGQGEAEKRRLIMQADGALAIKVDAWLKSQSMWANAFKDFKGQVTPQIIMSGGSETGGNAATKFMDIMSAKAARDLSVIMTPGGEPKK